MKILHVSCDGLGNGGVQSVIMNICRNSSGVQSDILLFTSERRHYDDEFERLGGNIYRIPNYEGKNRYKRKLDYYFRFLRIFFGTYKVLKENGPYNAIHCHNDLESGICNLAAFIAGVKIRVSHAHTSHNKFNKSNLPAFIYKKVLQKVMNLTTNRKIGCTQEAFISIFGERNLEKPNAYIIPNSIDLKKFKKSKRNKRNITNINIVHVGRYDENKNQLFIIDIMPYILLKIPNVKLKLVGFGDDYKIKLLDRVEKLNLKSHVEFLPPDSNVKEILEDASLFIFPSKHEGFGIVLIEAQAMRVPCLVSDSVPKIIDCGLCDFLSLSDSFRTWGDHAVNIINKNHYLNLNNMELDKFDVNKYTWFINSLYGGQVYESWDAYFSQSK